MHVAVDLNWLLQFIVLAVAAAFGFLYLVRNTASRFFAVDSNFGSTAADFSPDRKDRELMAAAVNGVAEVSDSCAVCGHATSKQCSRCKMVKYCSEACQRSHWVSEHKTKCKDLKLFQKANHTKSISTLTEMKASVVPGGRSTKMLKQPNKMLFPYEEFVQFFNWDKPGYPPCGLLNCGNSCFANVILQCLVYTRPLVAYLLEKGHRIECQKDDWCFLCEFQTHVETVSQSRTPFSPINILSRLCHIGGNLGYGDQEDAHEFMRFAIDTMQSVCLDEYGGEKAIHPSYQETTLIQHIFGGRFQSQVICTECNNVSNRLDNMMDLTVEIHGDAESLEECLDQFTAKEWLQGDNMYKCDGCNAYVIAWKRLTVQRAPNILTIALKRFQSGRFGKLNKKVTFPETLDLSSYMSEPEDGNDVYKLYAVIVHVDMLNASFFGHYICYVKDFLGNWYRIDDCKVARVDLDEVLSQGAYMLLYSRICARPSCLLPAESLKKQENENVQVQADLPPKQPTECSSAAECLNSRVDSGHLSGANCSVVEINCEEELSSITDGENARGDVEKVSCEASLRIINAEPHDTGLSIAPKEAASPILIDKDSTQPDVHHSEPSSISDVENASEDNIGDANEGLMRKSTEESTAAKNCMSEKDSTYDVSPIATAEVREVKSANPLSMPENGRKGSLLAKKSSGGSSGKLRPVFARGFLDKHPRKEIIKREIEVSVEHNGTTPENNNLDNQTIQVVKRYLSSENGSPLKDEEKPCSVLENGKVSTDFSAHKNLENGETKTNITKEKLLIVGQETSNGLRRIIPID